MKHLEILAKLKKKKKMSLDWLENNEIFFKNTYK